LPLKIGTFQEVGAPFLELNSIDYVANYGVTVKSVAIQDINPSGLMQDSMERQAAAERERRAIEMIAEATKGNGTTSHVLTG